MYKCGEFLHTIRPVSSSRDDGVQFNVRCQLVHFMASFYAKQAWIKNQSYLQKQYAS